MEFLVNLQFIRKTCNMKNLVLFAAMFLLAVSAKANINGNGYYRVQNYGSQRWASLIDNKGSIDKIAADADLHSLALIKDTEYILSDPGSIIYLTNIESNRYDVAAQGTSLQSLVEGYPIKIMKETEVGGEGLYRIYGTYDNVVLYIADGRINDSNLGVAALYNPDQADTDKSYVQWKFLPVNASGNNYFGPVPDVTIGNKYYTTVFTSFAYKPYSEGVKAYYIGRVGFGMAEMIEITSAVPPASPVIIECAGTEPGDNRMQLLESQDVLPNNGLTGVYFNYSDGYNTNHIPYDSQTMRVLGICQDGSLGFVVAKNLDYIPANTAYLKVEPGSNPEFKCVSTAEFEAALPEAPDQITFGDGQYFLQAQDDYTYTGTFNFPAPADGVLKFQFSSTSESGKTTILGPFESEGKDVSITLPANVPFEYGNNAYWIISNWTGGDLSITVNILYQSVVFQKPGNAAVNTIESVSSRLTYKAGVIASGNNASIKIYDLSGRLISQGQGSISIRELPKGIYVAESEGEFLKVAR